MRILVLVCTVLAGCADVPSKLDQEVAMQPVRPMHGGVAVKGIASINSSSLPEEKKEQLRQIFKRMAEETFKNQDETSRLKGVLFETITKTPYEPMKVEAIKHRLIELNDAKINNMFWALDEVEKVVAHTDPRYKRNLYKSTILEEESPLMAPEGR